MKKIFTLSFVLSIVTFICAQNVNKVGMTGPTFIDEFNQNDVNVTGVSPEGRFVYGMNGSGSAAIYDFENADPFMFLEATPADYFGISIAGFTPDGRALISHYTKSYFLNLKTNEQEFIESPDENFGMDAWDISADGNIIGCNLTTEDFVVIPMVAIKQADGTYKIEYLEYDKYDAMGCIAQYTQVRFVSDDGNYIMGIQPDNRGMCGRLVVWVKQEDGSYKFTTPMDEFLYDLSYAKPGLAPEWDDYVTADYETETELFNQQEEEYNKVFDEYEKNYMNFTKNRSSLEIYMMNKATRCNTICMAYYDNRVNMDSNLIPVFYDCNTNNITEYPEMINSFGIEQLPGGGYIVATDNSSLYSLTAIDKEGNAKPFEEWLKDLTGTDISADYHCSFYDYISDKDVEGVFPGLPYFSHDGKSLVFTGMNPELGTVSSVIKFDSDVFADTTTGINVNVTDEIVVGNNMIKIGAGKHGVADVYTLGGVKCGSYIIDGNLNLNNIVAKGTYLVNININGEKTTSLKMMVK